MTYHSQLSLLKSRDVMRILGYKDRGAFWCAVHRQGIPHVRLNARNIRFPEAGLKDWLRHRSSDGRAH